MTEQLRMYTTVAGELVSLVENNIPKCFVEYEQYLELKEAYEDLLERFDLEQQLAAANYS